PAGMGNIKDWQAMGSTSGPFYLLVNSDYHFLNYAKRINQKWVLGLSLRNLAIGESSFEVDIQGIDYPLNRPVINDLIFSAAAEPLENLFVGANIHLFSWKLFDEVNAARSIYFDLGSLYVLPLEDLGELQFGVGIINFLGSEIEFTAPDGLSSDNWFPIIGRYGIAWKRELTSAPFPLNYTVSTEIQNLFNSDVRNAFRMGGEIVAYDLVALRMGWFRQSEDDMDNSNNLSVVKDITYGFGIILPLKRLSKGKIPLEAQLDYYSMRNPPFVVSSSRRSNKRGFSIRVISTLNSKN
ncbi:MAG: hypothetical protein MRZ79_04635, partial [Bacteroidia bacterium]|nr:hypothetical protein [Bacteroidia bacterium]